MAFGYPPEVVSTVKQAAELIERFAQRIEDHGENMRLLDSVRTGDPVALAHLDQFIRSLIGPIWNLVDEPFSLDFPEGSVETVLRRFDGILDVTPQMKEALVKREYTDPWPVNPNTYRLWHAGGRRLSCKQVLDGVLGFEPGGQLAGWRELFAFMRLYGDQIGKYEIVAGGSSRGPHTVEPFHGYIDPMISFVCGRSALDLPDEKPGIGMKGHKRPKEPFFGPKDMFLLRAC